MSGKTLGEGAWDSVEPQTSESNSYMLPRKFVHTKLLNSFHFKGEHYIADSEGLNFVNSIIAPFDMRLTAIVVFTYRHK
jgi:hypothetical protein